VLEKGTNMNRQQDSTYPFVISATLLMLVAGVIHLIIAPIHYEHAPAHDLFFAVAGMVQVVLGLLIWRRPSARVYSTAAGGNRSMPCLIVYAQMQSPLVAPGMCAAAAASKPL
jgi:hypothetical protein